MNNGMREKKNPSWGSERVTGCLLPVCLFSRVRVKKGKFSSAVISGSLPLPMMPQWKGGVQTYILCVCVCDSYTQLHTLSHLGKNFLPSLSTSPHLLWLHFTTSTMLAKINDNSSQWVGPCASWEIYWKKCLQSQRHRHLRNLLAGLGFSGLNEQT